jgi:hypothetical protein
MPPQALFQMLVAKVWGFIDEKVGGIKGRYSVINMRWPRDMWHTQGEMRNSYRIFNPKTWET